MDNENIKLLRLRNFIIWKSLADEVFRSPDAQDKIATLIGIVEPFVRPPSYPSLLPRHFGFASPPVRACVYWILLRSARISYKALSPLLLFPFEPLQRCGFGHNDTHRLNPSSSEGDKGVSEGGRDEGERD